jgi:recombination endonuclease VII
MRRWRARNLEHSKAYQRGWIQRLRREVIDHYGGKCVCCGEAQLEFLSLDHKHGGGTKHRQALGLRGSGIWAWVKREKFPEIFQVMCHNCNQAIGYYGACPHERSR